MRSQRDPQFSTLCDRVGRGKINHEDEDYLRSRVQNTSLENENENFKNGLISIIVTVNAKKDLVNSEKLSQLLPNEREYTCNSVDRIVNLPSGPKISEKDQNNINKTGNLPNSLVN